MRVPQALLSARGSVHLWLFSATGGRIGRTWGGHPALLLTTVGHRSGMPHTTMLVVTYHEGSRLVVVASNGGSEREPHWCRNVRDNPAVSVLMDGTHRVMTASIADDEDRQRLWPHVVASAPAYAGYQRRTDREIPLVILEPREA